MTYQHVCDISPPTVVVPRSSRDRSPHQRERGYSPGQEEMGQEGMGQEGSRGGMNEVPPHRDTERLMMDEEWSASPDVPRGREEHSPSPDRRSSSEERESGEL